METMDVLDGSKKECNFSNTIFHFHLVHEMYEVLERGLGGGGGVAPKLSLANRRLPPQTKREI